MRKNETKYILFLTIFITLIILCISLLFLGTKQQIYKIKNPSRTNLTLTSNQGKSCDESVDSSCILYPIGKKLEPGFYTINLKFNHEGISDISKIIFDLDLNKYLNPGGQRVIAISKYLTTVNDDTLTLVNFPIDTETSIQFSEIPDNLEQVITVQKQDELVAYNKNKPQVGFYVGGQTINQGTYIIEASNKGDSDPHIRAIPKDYNDYGLLELIELNFSDEERFVIEKDQLYFFKDKSLITELTR